MTYRLDQKFIQQTLGTLFPFNAAYAARYPGETDKRQPVHVVYGGAHLFKSNTAKKIGSLAVENMLQFAPTPEIFCEIFKWHEKGQNFSKDIHARVLKKLQTEAVEDLRIDFEDGYGYRSDTEEDGHAEKAALELAHGMKEKTLSPFIGVRIKPLTEELASRSVRTLDIFLGTLLEKTQGRLPENFVVTLPKITIAEQVKSLCEILAAVEKQFGLSQKTIQIEIMIETLQSIFDSSGKLAMPELVSAADGRCVAAHFGSYDYTAACNITADYQNMGHVACDIARHLMQLSLSGTGVRLSDSACTIIPVKGDQKVTHHAWQRSYHHTRHSLECGFYQGWDLHPSQLPARYAALFSFFLEGVELISNRLKNFVAKASEASMVGDVFDDAATGQGLLNFFLRGLACGALTEQEALATGLTLEEIRTRSFAKIMKGRRR
ncbi:MAG: phosphoenolpyruvate kinase [Bdellovibrionales bacterium GWA2_49_15]|nr:MAG: phosphoenolpyruvate kinase [Bdellovibrionales bacterium GWA2_49_15]HAZ13047.1 phosphoenolpyruvate kinase [Bdellovibrionales bacterium]